MIIFLQILVAIILFFLINIIGKYAPTDLKYFQISSFLETDEAPAFNFSFRVLTPVVFIIILSAILYHFNLDKYVVNIYYVSIFYVVFRAFFNISIGRIYLVNWNKQFLYGFFIIALSYFVYQKVIITKENLLPDFSNIANELWIIILVFIYTLINNVPPSNSGAGARKFEYIKSMLNFIEKKYLKIINPAVNGNIRLKQIIYAIIIHENFNRPKAFRLIEYLSRLFTSKEKTYGIMQVRSKKAISDTNSVEIGTKIILDNFKTLITEYKSKIENKEDNENYHNSTEYIDNELQNLLVRNYNQCDDYTSDIIQLADYINEKFYRGEKKNKLLFASV